MPYEPREKESKGVKAIEGKTALGEDGRYIPYEMEATFYLPYDVRQEDEVGVGDTIFIVNTLDNTISTHTVSRVVLFTYDSTGKQVLAFTEEIPFKNQTVIYDIDTLVHAFADRQKAQEFIKRRQDASGLSKLGISVESSVLDAFHAKMMEEDRTALMMYDHEGRGNKRNGLIQILMKRYIDGES
jgi:hypothetical protein